MILSTQGNPKSLSLSRSFGFLLTGLLALALISFSLVMFLETIRYSDIISRDYARLYSNELVGELEGEIGREITLSVKAAADPVIRDWLLAEDDPERKLSAARAFASLSSIFQGRDFFVATEPGRKFRFFPKDKPPALDNILGTLSPENPEDLWFFKSLEFTGEYHLNIDTDRYLNTTRVWVNCPVRMNGRVIAVLGSGMYLDPLVKAIILGHERRGARSIVINRLGAIQLDQDLTNIQENSYEPLSEDSNSVYRYYDSPSFRVDLERYLQNPTIPIVLPLKGGAYTYVAISPIMDTGWHAVTFFGLGQLYDPGDMIRLGLFLALILSLTLLALFFGMNQLFLKPFRVLVDSLNISGYDSRSPIAGLNRHDEFGVLARSIRDLTDRLVQSVPVGMFLLDDEGKFLYGNPFFLQQFKSTSQEEFAQRFKSELPSLFVAESDYHILRQFMRDRRQILDLETQMVDFLGMKFWAHLHIKRLLKQTGREEYEGLLLNIQNQKNNEDRLTNLATTDQLTGLYNRYHLEHWIGSAINRSDRLSEHLSLIMFDLDHFKLINDSYGHDVGDEVLVNAVKAARASLRDADILIRWGGEEFVALLPDTELEGALVVAEKLRQNIANSLHSKAGVVTASFGVAERSNVELWSSWFKRADEALFDAKKEGRNRVSKSANL